MDLPLYYCVVALAGRDATAFYQPLLPVTFFTKMKKKEGEPFLQQFLLHSGVFCSPAGVSHGPSCLPTAHFPGPGQLPLWSHRGGRGLLVIFQVLLSHWHDNAQHSSLFFFFFSIVWRYAVIWQKKPPVAKRSKVETREQASLAFLWGPKLPAVNCSHQKNNW